MKIKSLFLALSVALLAPTGCVDDMSDEQELLDSVRQSGEEPSDDIAAEDEPTETEPGPDSVDDFAVQITPVKGDYTCRVYEGKTLVKKFSVTSASAGTAYCNQIYPGKVCICSSNEPTTVE